MVSFSCESCNDTLAKKKLDHHLNRCGGPFTCLDCNTTFQGTQYRAHTSCISEAQKYQGAMYRPEKQKGKGKNTNAKPALTPASKPAEPEPVLLPSVTPAESTPANTATNDLLAIGSGFKTIDPVTVTPTATDTEALKKEKRKQEKKERIKARKEKESPESTDKKRKRDEAVELSLEKLADHTAPIATPAAAVKELNGSQKKRQKKKENKLPGAGKVGSAKDHVDEGLAVDVQEALVVNGVTDAEMKDIASVKEEGKVAEIETTTVEKVEKSRKDRGKKDKKAKKEKRGKQEKAGNEEEKAADPEVLAVVTAPSALDGLLDTPMTNGTDTPAKSVVEEPKPTKPVIEAPKPAEKPAKPISSKKDKNDKKPEVSGKNQKKVEKKKNGAAARKAQPKNRARDLLQSVPDKATSLTEVLGGMSSEEQAKILRNLMVTKKKTGQFVLKLADGE